MKKTILLVFSLIVISPIIGCKEKTKKEDLVEIDVKVPKLTIEQANRLAGLPFKCIDKEYPNKPNLSLDSKADLGTPKEIHPAFYGCFDWHSSVHGHWSLVYLLKKFPSLKNAERIKKKLLSNMSKENLAQEVAYFKSKRHKSFERTYGWSWFLKLMNELHTWDAAVARKLEDNLQPLADILVKRYIEYLPNLRYPIRVGTHSNTAFGLSFAWDYAILFGNKELKRVLVDRANEFYAKDQNCPIGWEPGGSDFLSPCLEEAALMKRILPKNQFQPWLANFLPQLMSKNFSLSPAEVLDRTDGHLVHLDGINFSRAWNLAFISKDIPEYHYLRNTACSLINYSLPHIVDGDYMGEHWLASFAINALDSLE